MAGFTQDLSTFVRKTRINGGLVVKKLAFDAFRGVVQKSPVATGYFRGNWRIGVNTIDLSTSAAPAGGKQGAAPDLSQASKLEGVKWGDTVSITNDTVYGGRLEGGYSKQAPQGMLRLTFEEVKASLRRNVQKVVNG